MRLAESSEDRVAACRLRFRVFNIEMGEGLEKLLSDRHRHGSIRRRLRAPHRRRQAGGQSRRGASWAPTACRPASTAARYHGYYSEQEFDLAPYEPLRPGVLELGRASIDREHRTPEVLTLLWRGIAQYATDMGLRYLIGCSSLTSKDPAEGWELYRQLEHFRVPPSSRPCRPPPTHVPSSSRRTDAQPSACITESSSSADDAQRSR